MLKCLQILIMSSFVVLLKDKFKAVIKVLCPQTIKYGLYVCVCSHLLHMRYQKTHSTSKLRLCLGMWGYFLMGPTTSKEG